MIRLHSLGNYHDFLAGAETLGSVNDPAMIVLAGGAKGTRTPDPLLAQQALAVGYGRPPGKVAMTVSAGIESCRILLWSGLVVSPARQRLSQVIGTVRPGYCAWMLHTLIHARWHFLLLCVIVKPKVRLAALLDHSRCRTHVNSSRCSVRNLSNPAT